MRLNSFTIKDFDNVIFLAKNSNLKDEDIITIINSLAKSGSHFQFQDNTFADIPSTGGPSSLSTLICPYILTQFGLKVPKLGVKGRPAGGIDVLAQIEDFKLNYTLREVKEVLKENNYCHFIADERITPLDASFFKYRSENNAKAIPELVIASILSKKVAMGIKHMGIDIRYFAGGNFGETFDTSYNNALRFIRVAKKLEINCTAFLTNLKTPIQPYIGRGEALLAMDNIFNQNMCSWLKSHFDDCVKMSISVSPYKNISTLSHNQLFAIFKKHLESQGSKIDLFNRKVDEIKHAKRYNIYSKETGFLQINLDIIRSIIVKYQSLITDISFPDNIGIILLKQGNEFVYKEEPVCSLRFENLNNKDELNKAIKEFEQAFSVTHEIPEIENFKIINL